MTPQEFYSQYLPYAQSVSRRTGLDPRLVLAQAALETGYGKSAPGMNFFGIKSHGRKGGQTLQSSEFQGGQMVSQPASFRTYETPEQSFQDYADFLESNPRYKGVLSAEDLGGQIAEMAKSGYATDPQYGAKLANIASKFDPNSSSITDVSDMAALNRNSRGILAPQQANSTESKAMNAAQPRGLLSSLGIQRMQEGAEGETGQRFYERESFKDTAATLSQAFAALGGDPAIQKFASNIASQRTEAKARNKTVEYLRQSGRNELADLVERGMISGTDAASQLLATPKEKGKVVDASVLRQMFPGAKVDDGLYNLKPDGTANKIGGGGVSVQNVVKPGQVDAEEELRKKLMQKKGEGFSKMLDAGSASASAMTDLNILQQLAPLAPSGPLTGRLSEAFPEFNDVASLRQSIVKRVAPTLRVEGSGATSDLEFNAMLNSLGSLRNAPEANQAIIAVMQEKAKYNMDRAAVIRAYETNKINLEQANEQLASLDGQSRIPAQVQLILDRYASAGEGAAAPSGAREKRWNPSLNNGAGGFE